MAQRKKRRVSRAKKPEYPPFAWMLFGLAIGLSVAFAVYVKDREPAVMATTAAPQPASLKNTLEDNNEEAKPAAVDETPADKRFTFYDILPNFEVITPDRAPDVEADDTPQAIDADPFCINHAAMALARAMCADITRARITQIWTWPLARRSPSPDKGI